jgi:hypothetical protein
VQMSVRKFRFFAKKILYGKHRRSALTRRPRRGPAHGLGERRPPRPGKGAAPQSSFRPWTMRKPAHGPPGRKTPISPQRGLRQWPFSSLKLRARRRARDGNAPPRLSRANGCGDTVACRAGRGGLWQERARKGKGTGNSKGNGGKGRKSQRGGGAIHGFTRYGEGRLGAIYAWLPR